MMKILIAYASRHGSTREIAQVLAQELRVCGHSVAVRTVGEVERLDGYEAAVIGSAVYLSNWLPEARRFVTEHDQQLARIPVWLFSSGPLGSDDPQPTGDPAHLDDLVHMIRAQSHRVLVGKMDRSGLGPAERLVARVVKAPEGDFRDWDVIRAWAREIALALPALTVSAH
jgi:menaquinone-dependent protoporphyrinogen oxidase